MAAGDLQGVADMYKAMTTRGIQPDICTFVALFKVDDTGTYAPTSAAYHMLHYESGVLLFAPGWTAALPVADRLGWSCHESPARGLWCRWLPRAAFESLYLHSKSAGLAAPKARPSSCSAPAVRMESFCRCALAEAYAESFMCARSL